MQNNILLPCLNIIKAGIPTLSHIDTKENIIQQGYIFAISETKSNLVYIGWTGKKKISEILAILQKGNSRLLKIMHIARRSNINNAAEICDVIYSGITMYNMRGNWYDIKPENLRALFKNIDPL